MSVRLRRPLAALGLAILLPVPALADSIDGRWCSDDGRQMTIAGPQIVTPGGARLAGNYDRHAFSYAAPAAEPGAGSTISMVLVNEDTVRVQAEKPAPRTETWRRCGPPTS